MGGTGKTLVWLRGDVKTPPFSREARLEPGFFLRQLQQGERLVTHSRPLPSLGPRCHELRIRDRARDWRIVYRIDRDAIVIADVFEKKSQKTPQGVFEAAKQRFAKYDSDSRG